MTIKIDRQGFLQEWVTLVGHGHWTQKVRYKVTRNGIFAEFTSGQNEAQKRGYVTQCQGILKFEQRGKILKMGLFKWWKRDVKTGKKFSYSNEDTVWVLRKVR